MRASRRRRDRLVSVFLDKSSKRANPAPVPSPHKGEGRRPGSGRLELRRLRLAFPHEAVHDEPADRYRARQTMGGCVLVDDGEEFNWHADFGCGGTGFEHDSPLMMDVDCGDGEDRPA